jgi:hypothetical protein
VDPCADVEAGVQAFEEGRVDGRPSRWSFFAGELSVVTY